MKFTDLYMDQPYEVSIETLAMCNAACTFCPYPTLERKGTKLPDALIHNFIHQMESWKYPFFISPFKVNEPLLDVRLFWICELINRTLPLARLRLFTNGSPLNESKIAEIAQLKNVEHLWISLNSVDVDEYQRLMSLSFIRTADNLDTLHSCVTNALFSHPVILSRVCARDPMHPVSVVENTKFSNYCRKRWPRFEAKIIKQDGWLGYVPPSSPMIPNTPCVRWFELSILATGIVSLCCMDGKGEFPIGDANKLSLLDIYNAPYWRDRRYHMMSRREVFPCSTCTY